MGLFDVLGGIASQVVPGFSTLAATGVFGDAVRDVTGGGDTPAAALSAKHAALIAAGMPPPPGMFPPSAVAAPAAAPAAAPVGTINVPVNFLRALTAEARRVTFGTYVPPQAAARVAPPQISPLDRIVQMSPNPLAVPFR